LKVDLGSTLIVCCLLLSGLPSSSDVCENDWSELILCL
jgi:hypothetical protein